MIKQKENKPMKPQYYKPTFHQLSGEPVHERVFTIEDLSKMFNVSTKTVSRWRNDGLNGLPLKVDGRKRLGFLESSVDEFVRHNPERVQRGSRFSQLNDAERITIIDEARRMISSGRSAAEVISKLANESGRSCETIRYTIKHHDHEHPEQAVFATGGTIAKDTRESIYQRFRSGASCEVISKRFGLRIGTTKRLVREMRAARIMELPLDWMPSPDFDNPDAQKIITGPIPESESPPRKARVPANLPAYLASLYETPLLTSEQEVHLFRKYNYLKYRAAALRDQVDAARPKSRLMDQIEHYYDQVVETKNQIIQANLRLVVSIVKRYVSDNERLFSLVSDGNISLMRAVEKFDYTRGFKFSTYATWAIKKNHSRKFASEMKQADRFKTSRDELLLAQAGLHHDPLAEERAQQQRASQVRMILRGLDARERAIIESRFGLAPAKEPLTLREVGEQFGVSKERVRQLESRALDKLRRDTRVAKIEI